MSHADREAIDWDLVDELVFGCLEHEGTARDEAIARACADHPELAPVLRRCIERLDEAGLLREKGTQHLPSGLRQVYDGSMAAEAPPANGDEHGRSPLEPEGAGTAPPNPPSARGSILDRLSERPQQIGPYRILDALGQGGMGTVYLAEQTEPVHRRLALKVIKLGMDSKAVLQRFDLERQALAVMNHDGIAKVFNCGTTERGQPYFVMELVKGIPLNHYCDRNRLSLPQRLMLMQQVCAAVQHAHQKGVVHRDLKPGNVLVSDEGGKLQVKIIDFGLAKAMGKRLVEATLCTEAGQILGTPEYMAPEQADPTNQDIDTRADIYSLGVMLYELLVGSLPFSGRELRSAGMLGVQRILREVEPPKPSTKLTSSSDTAAGIAAARRMSTSALVKALEHDLNWVVLKTLEKDRNRRYETASALAADLQRFLDHEPLVAGPPSAAYRLSKLMRRYRGQVLAASAVLVALIGGGIGTFVQYLRAEDRAAAALTQQGLAEAQEQLATRRAAENARLAQEKSELAAAEAKAKYAAQQRAEELEHVLTYQESQWQDVDTESMGAHLRRSVLAAAKPARRADLEAGLEGVNFTSLALGMLQENLFDPFVAEIGTGLAEQPLVKARLLLSIATTMRVLGMSDRARAPQSEALEIRRDILGDDHPDTLTSINRMGLLRQAQGGLAEAELLLREALERRRRTLGDDHRDVVTSIINLGSILQDQGKLAEAELLFREAMEKSGQIDGDEQWHTLAATHGMGLLLQAQGRFAEAEPYCRDVLAKRRQILGDDHLNTLASMGNMGTLLVELGRLDEAEPFFREALERSRRTLGDDHPTTMSVTHNLGGLLQRQGKLTAAEPLRREALERRRRILGDDHPDTLHSMNDVGLLLDAQGRLVEAEPLWRETLAKRRRVLGDDHSSTLTSIANLGQLLLELGKLDEAAPLHREAMDRSRRVLGDDHPTTLSTIDNMGRFLQAQGRLAEAEPLLEEVLDKRRRVLGEDHPQTLGSINNLGNLFMAQGKLTAAEPLLREALAKYRRILGDDHPNTLGSISNLGSVLNGQGRLDEAEPLLEEAMEMCRRILGGDHPDTLTCVNNMGLFLVSRGKFAEAEPLIREVLEKRREILGDDHADTLKSVTSMGYVLNAQGKPAEAEPLYREALERSRRLLGDDHPLTLGAINNLGTLLKTLGKLDEAESLYNEGLETHRRALGDAHPATQILVLNMGSLLVMRGKLAEAEPFFREAQEEFGRTLGSNHPNTLIAISFLGGLLVQTGRYSEAVTLLSTAEAAARKAFTGGNARRLASFLWDLGRAHAGQGQLQDFKSAEAELREAHAIFTNLRGPAHHDTRRCTQALVDLYDAWHVAEPANGHDQQAAEWKAKLEPSPAKEVAK